MPDDDNLATQGLAIGPCGKKLLRIVISANTAGTVRHTKLYQDDAENSILN